MTRNSSCARVGMITAVTVILALGGMSAGAASLVTYYRFDNAVTNAVAGAPDGTRGGTGGANNLPQYVAGTNGLGTALDFDGTDDFVSTTTNGFPNGNGGFGVGSLSFWVKSTDSGECVFMACFDSGGSMAFQVQGNKDVNGNVSSGRMTVYLRPLEGTGTDPNFYHLGFAVNHDSNWNDGQWHHIVITWKNLANANYGSSVLIDGVDQALTDKQSWRPLNPGARTYRGSWLGGRVMNIGRRVVSAGAQHWIDGTLDDYGVFTGQLTDGEAKAIYNLAVEREFLYDLGEVDQILQEYAAPTGGISVDRGKWTKVSDLSPGTPGDLVRNGLNRFTLYLTATEGMAGVIIRKGTVFKIK